MACVVQEDTFIDNTRPHTLGFQITHRTTPSQTLTWRDHNWKMCLKSPSTVVIRYTCSRCYRQTVCLGEHSMVGGVVISKLISPATHSLQLRQSILQGVEPFKVMIPSYVLDIFTGNFGLNLTVCVTYS